jgi:hypothetical protein
MVIFAPQSLGDPYVSILCLLRTHPQNDEYVVVFSKVQTVSRTSIHKTKLRYSTAHGIAVTEVAFLNPLKASHYRVIQPCVHVFNLIQPFAYTPGSEENDFSWPSLHSRAIGDTGCNL